MWNFGSINVNDWNHSYYRPLQKTWQTPVVNRFANATGRYDCVEADYDIKRLKRSELELIKSSTVVFGHSRLITDDFLDNQPVIRDNIFVSILELLPIVNHFRTTRLWFAN